jgi:hypothetical protein
MQDVVPTPIPHPTISNDTPQKPGTKPNKESTGGAENRIEGRASGAGAEGLLQEELDEIADDPDTNLDGGE